MFLIYFCLHSTDFPKSGVFSTSDFTFLDRHFLTRKFFHKFPTAIYQISSKINVFITTVSFHHFVSSSSKTESFGASS